MKPRRNPPCHTERSPNDTGELHYKSSVEGATKNQDAGKSKVLLQVQQNIRNALATENLIARATRVRAGNRLRALQELLGQTVAGAVRVFTERTELFLDAQTRCPAEVIDEGRETGMLGIGRVVFQQRARTQARGRDRENFRSNIDEAAQEKLLALELRSVPEHGMEQRTSQSAAGSGGVTQMPFD